MFDERKLLVSAGWAGVVFIALVLVGAFAGGAPPDADPTAAEVREYLADNRTALLWGLLVGLLGTIPGVWFVGVLARTIRRVTGDWVLPVIVVIGLVLVAAMAWAAQAVAGAVIWSDGFIDTASDELVLYSWNAASLMYAASAMGFAVFLGAAAWAVLRTGLMPAAVGWLAVLGGVLSVVAAFATVDAGAGTLVFLGFLSWSVWVVVASITMIVGKVTVTSPARPVGA